MAQKKCTILVVEDDRDIREAMVELLESEGHQVEQAANGQEALGVLEKLGNETCLILLDLMMPVMSGWDFLALRKKNVALASIPVCVVSAVTDSLPEGTPRMRKPVEVEPLLTLVNLYCR